MIISTADFVERPDIPWEDFSNLLSVQINFLLSIRHRSKAVNFPPQLMGARY